MGKAELGQEKKRRVCFPMLHAFDFDIQYALTDRYSHVREIDMHSHRECEIYVNLSGDVSFMVEDRLYPLTRGDVILARPGEFHHCVYRSDAPHAMFWILFDGTQNRELLSLFYGDERVNFISPTEDGKRELIELCFRLHGGDLSVADRYISFFRLLDVLSRSVENRSQRRDTVPRTLGDALLYIDQHITESICVSDMAEVLHYSESTVERTFKKHLGMTPIEFIRKKKMTLAAWMLRNGETVLNTGVQLGYADNSHFIKLFREAYGVTPLQYQKSHRFESN